MNMIIFLIGTYTFMGNFQWQTVSNYQRVYQYSSYIPSNPPLLVVASPYLFMFSNLQIVGIYSCYGFQSTILSSHPSHPLGSLNCIINMAWLVVVSHLPAFPVCSVMTYEPGRITISFGTWEILKLRVINHCGQPQLLICVVNLTTYHGTYLKVIV